MSSESSPYARPCDCSHPFPLCVCREGIHGKIKRLRARKLSRMAGWPHVEVTEEAAAEVIAIHGWPVVVEDATPPVFESLPPWTEVWAGLQDQPPAKPCDGCGGGRA